MTNASTKPRTSNISRGKKARGWLQLALWQRSG